MGVDSLIYIRRDARVRDIADVIGILAGLKPYRRDFSQGDGWACHVDGASADACKSLPQCCEINIQAPDGYKLIDGEQSHYVLWHWEPSRMMGDYHLIMPRSTPFWIAIGRGLCKFFGGKIDYNDCDPDGINARFKGMRKDNSPEDGKPWTDFQQAKLDLKPLTMRDLEKAGKWSSYKLEEMA